MNSSSTTSRFIEDLEKSPVKVNTGSLQEIKIALDDTLVKYLNDEAGYVQNHGSTDMHLSLQFLLNAIGGLTAYYAYTHSFEESKWLVGLACIIYFLISSIWSAYYFLFEKADVYRGKRADHVILIDTCLKAPSTLYTIQVRTNTGKKSLTEVTFKKPIEQWFDTTGKLDALRFAQDWHTWLASLATKKTQ